MFFMVSILFFPDDQPNLTQAAGVYFTDQIKQYSGKKLGCNFPKIKDFG